MTSVSSPVLIAVANQNGGVGKTTTTMNLGAALSELEDSVLLALNMYWMAQFFSSMGIASVGAALVNHAVSRHNITYS